MLPVRVSCFRHRTCHLRRRIVICGLRAVCEGRRKPRGGRAGNANARWVAEIVARMATPCRPQPADTEPTSQISQRLAFSRRCTCRFTHTHAHTQRTARDISTPAHGAHRSIPGKKGRRRPCCEGPRPRRPRPRPRPRPRGREQRCRKGREEAVWSRAGRRVIVITATSIIILVSVAAVGAAKRAAG
jgi:hypothetical protein